jgi:hypothetical protein
MPLDQKDLFVAAREEMSNPSKQSSLKNKTGILSAIPFHLLFFITYPVLSLYATNINQIPGYAILRSIIFSMVLGGVVYLVNLAVLRNALKAALMTSIVILLFHFYGHVYDALNQMDIARHSVLTALWLVIGGSAFFFIFRHKGHPHQVTQLFNIVGGFLVLLTLSQIIVPKVNFKVPSPGHEKNVTAVNATTPDDWIYRNIYYIIVDAYTSDDVLADKFNYDNSAFIEDLENHGFRVVRNAKSNYDNTFESLTSSLNMDYLDQLGLPPEVKDFDKKMELIGDLLPHSHVRKIFEDMGYTTIAFHTKAPWANLDDADIYYQADERVPYIDRLDTLSFHDLYLKTTWIRFLFDTSRIQPITSALNASALLGWIDPNNYAGSLLEITDEERFENIRYMEYKQNLYSLDNLEKVPDIPGSKFVHAHIMVTHSSFVFNQDGSYKENADESNAAYVEQIQYLNKRLLEIIETIQEKESVPPVIIIQADHGYIPGEEKVAILHALYLPDGGVERIYPEITPVNTFRIILNSYFNYQLELLPDRSFYRDVDSEELIEVFNSVD